MTLRPTINKNEVRDAFMAMATRSHTWIETHLTIDEFKKWVESKPEHCDIGVCRSPSRCPIAEYVRENISVLIGVELRHVLVTVTDSVQLQLYVPQIDGFFTANTTINFSGRQYWCQFFISEVDKVENADATKGYVLNCLDTVELFMNDRDF